MSRNIEVAKVSDIVTRKVIAFTPDFSLLDVIQNFNKYRIAAAPVVNDNNEVIGYLTESDCIKSLGNSLFYDDLKSDAIDTVMTTDVAVAEGDWDIFELENFFVTRHLRSAPVVDSENHLVGIVTRRDAMQALEKLMHEREEYKEKIKTPVELNRQNRIKMIINRVT